MSAKHISISVPCVLQVLIITVANRPVKAVYTHYFYFILTMSLQGAGRITEQTPGHAWSQTSVEAPPIVSSL